MISLNELFDLGFQPQLFSRLQPARETQVQHVAGWLLPSGSQRWLAGKSSKIEVNSWDNHLQMGKLGNVFSFTIATFEQTRGKPWIIGLSHLPKKPDWTCHHGHGQPAIHQ